MGAHNYILKSHKIPAIGKGAKDPIVHVKLFTPDSNWTWFITEYDGQDRCFGLVHGFEKELGYFSIAEITAARGPMGLRIERDLYWTPVPLSEVK